MTCHGAENVLNQQGLPSGRRRPLTLNRGCRIAFNNRPISPSPPPLPPPLASSTVSFSHLTETWDLLCFVWCISVGMGELLNDRRPLVGRWCVCVSLSLSLSLKNRWGSFAGALYLFHHHYLSSTKTVYQQTLPRGAYQHLAWPYGAGLSNWLIASYSLFYHLPRVYQATRSLLSLQNFLLEST